MAKSVNKVILVGNVGQDPEVKYTPSGVPVARVSLATNERFKDGNDQWQDRQSGEKKYRTEIVARDLVLLGSRENGQNAAAQAAGRGSDTEPAPAVVDDDIPF